MSKCFTWPAFALLVTGLARVAPGQAADAAAQGQVERFERTLDQIQRDTRLQVLKDVPVGSRALFDYGGYLTLSYLSFDDPADTNRAFRGYDLVGYARADFDGAHQFYLRGRATYRDFNRGDSFNDEGDRLEGRLEEAYYLFDRRAYDAAYRGAAAGDDNLVVQVGRQFHTWANGLVLSQYVDGGRVAYERGPLAVELLAAITAYGTVDFDISRPEFDDQTYRGFFGGLLSYRVGRHRPFAYALAQRDFNDEDETDVGLITTKYEYDSYYLGIGANGSLGDRLVYGVEAVYEGGQGNSNSFDPETFRPVDQTDENIDAFAADLRLDYLFADPRRTRLGAGLVVATGDDDRITTSGTFGGNRTRTDDHAFNALGLVDDGLAFSPSISNIVILRGTVSTYPWPGVSLLGQLQVGAEGYVFAKFDKDAPVDEPTDDSRYLGCEPDLFVNWQILDDVTLTLRYGVFFPGDAIDSEKARQFFYSGLTYAF